MCCKFAIEKFKKVNSPMDIVSRIKLFLSQNGIANSQFADTCEIPRPTLSQLLNGRNKKVSDEVLTKIHNAYPTLNMMWLMFGDGNMFVPNENSGDFAMAPQPVETQAKSIMPENASDNAKHPQINFGENDATFSGAPKHDAGTSPNALSMALQSIARSAGKNNTVNASKPAADGRRIVNIMVFYTDNSFESFTPGR